MNGLNCVSNLFKHLDKISLGLVAHRVGLRINNMLPFPLTLDMLVEWQSYKLLPFPLILDMLVEWQSYKLLLFPLILDMLVEWQCYKLLPFPLILDMLVEWQSYKFRSGINIPTDDTP